MFQWTCVRTKRIYFIYNLVAAATDPHSARAGHTTSDRRNRVRQYMKNGEICMFLVRVVQPRHVPARVLRIQEGALQLQLLRRQGLQLQLLGCHQRGLVRVGRVEGGNWRARDGRGSSGGGGRGRGHGGGERGREGCGMYVDGDG